MSVLVDVLHEVCTSLPVRSLFSTGLGASIKAPPKHSLVALYLHCQVTGCRFLCKCLQSPLLNIAAGTASGIQCQCT
eukprot:4595270-Alexandrium_andersonii.AAC.1